MSYILHHFDEVALDGTRLIKMITKKCVEFISLFEKRGGYIVI